MLVVEQQHAKNYQILNPKHPSLASHIRFIIYHYSWFLDYGDRDAVSIILYGYVFACINVHIHDTVHDVPAKRNENAYEMDV